MSEEFDDLESSEEETPVTPASDLPDWAKEQVSQANREAQGLRKRLKERESEILTSKYEGVIDLLPDEVTSYDAKVAFLEKAAAKLGSTKQVTEPTEHAEAESTPTEEPTEAEKNLAAVAKGPSSTGVSPSGFSQDELLQIAMTDPERYDKLRSQGVSLPKLSWGPDR